MAKSFLGFVDMIRSSLKTKCPCTELVEQILRKVYTSQDVRIASSVGEETVESVKAAKATQIQLRFESVHGPYFIVHYLWHEAIKLGSLCVIVLLYMKTIQFVQDLSTCQGSRTINSSLSSRMDFLFRRQNHFQLFAQRVGRLSSEE